MVEFDVEMTGTDPDDLAKRLSSTGTLKSDVNDALMEEAEKIKTKIEDSAPVDTGAYESSWYIEAIDEDEVWVLSSGEDAPYNQYLMLPNQNFVGSSNADLPAQGIYHNVEGIAKNHQKQFSSGIANQIQSFIDDISGD